MDQLEDERAFATSELEAKITAPESNRKIIEELKKYTDEHERQFRRFPKTLVFAVNDLPIRVTPTRSSSWPVRSTTEATLCREDHRQGRSSAPEDSRVPQPSQPWHRRDGGPADDRRRYT